ncbi:DM13 domain-containing protein [Vannielia litorea]|uniref:Electron transfer DM13 n=1 Tax=Vannielia litorea TaxID=1217970 RepID=A0A1N6H1P7_9RHOB|nr:DM13 domain-containing protein [Vannielia litorea]SIO13607.1 Electron transfer DM13 [Vannielia litorea]
MKRLLLIAAPSFLLGAVFGAAFWYLASPLWIDRVVNESLVTGQGVTVLAEGRFRDAGAAHRGTGTARLVTLPDGRVEVQLTDFEVTNGPDLELWLSDAPDPQSSSEVSGGDWVSLGLLKGNIGDQSYTVPPSIDATRYRSVVVWCEQFGVLFSPAPLAAPGG